jgi:hypothetical protein
MHGTYNKIKGASPTCFDISVPSSCGTNCQFAITICHCKAVIYKGLRSVAASLLTLIKYKGTTVQIFKIIIIVIILTVTL